MKYTAKIPLRFRKAEIQDIPYLSLVIQESIEKTYSKHYSTDEICVWKALYSEQAIKELFLLEREIWVIIIDQIIRGTIHYDYGLNEICTFYIHPLFQNLGLGKLMMQGVLCFKRLDGLKEVELSSNPFVKDWYEREFSFKVIKKEIVFCGGLEFEEYRMRKILKPKFNRLNTII